MSKNKSKGQEKKKTPVTKMPPQKKALPVKAPAVKALPKKKARPKMKFNASLMIGGLFGLSLFGLGLYGAIGQGHPGGFYISALGLLVMGAIVWSYKR